MHRNLSYRRIRFNFLSENNSMIDKETVRTQMDEMKVKGNQLVGKVKEIIEEGNARRVTIRKEGRTLL